MHFYADLHIHSKYSRATSRNCDLENLAYWGRKKGITVIGTGDFTHPAWMKEIKKNLVPAEPGLYRLKPDLEKAVFQKLPQSCQGPVRFLLSVEISTIYKKGDKVRKIHHLVYSPTIEQAEKINAKLGAIGNIRSDGRPILGLDSRHLLEIVLQEGGSDCFLVPAHIWTPWFAVLGSKSGFDAVDECYADLAQHVFAVETGLSSDPEMNWRVSSLDKYRLISNSDAHSPSKLGREVNQFNTNLDYYSLRKALETGNGFGGTLEFFPEEGKYHLDGHRKCGVCLQPEESKRNHGNCPECGKPLTLGVLYRVNELADRKEHEKPPSADSFKSLIPLSEVISEINGVGVASQQVQKDYETILAKLGSELSILNELPLEEIKRLNSPLLTEAISRMRQGKVIRQAGYDGEYGVIKVFKEEELKQRPSVGVLFDLETVSKKVGSKKKKEAPVILEIPKKKIASVKKSPEAGEGNILDALDPDQQKAAMMTDGPLLILAGPGSGKTRTLTHRVAHLIQSGKALPQECLTITFTRRAANEMRERLQQLLPQQWHQIPVMTFHALAFGLIQKYRVEVGLPRGFKVVTEEEKLEYLKETLDLSERKIKKALRQIDGSLSPDIVTALEQKRDTEGWIGFDELIFLAGQLFEQNRDIQAQYQQQYRFISIDEYQDIDAAQYRLIQLLVGKEQNICVIGDPDQAIYSFRGSDVSFFLQFEKDFPAAQTIHLTKNYRSGRSILSASTQMIAVTSLVQDRQIEALLEDTGKVVIQSNPTEKAEAEFVVHTVEKLIGGTTFFSIDSGRSEGKTLRDYSFSDFAILYRVESQAQALVEAFERSGIPFQCQSHQSSTQDPLAFESDSWDPRADRVSFLTLHAAKGLEFSVVFIVGCEEGLLPLKWGNEISAEELAEERRLFFVGMTRAKERLFLSHAAKRLWQGKVRERKPSSFLKNIEERLLDHQKNSYRKALQPLSHQLELF